MKWYTIAMSIQYCLSSSFLLLFFFSPFFSFIYLFIYIYISFNSQFVLILGSFLPLSQTAQMTLVVEGRLKGIIEEADKEKALKQVVEANLNEKTLELNAME